MQMPIWQSGCPKSGPRASTRRLAGRGPGQNGRLLRMSVRTGGHETLTSDPLTDDPMFLRAFWGVETCLKLMVEREATGTLGLPTQCNERVTLASGAAVLLEACFHAFKGCRASV